MAHEFFVGEDEQNYFRVKARNGEILASSEGYTRAQDAVRGYGALRRAILADLFVTMFEGFKLHEESWVRNPTYDQATENDKPFLSAGDYKLTEEEAMVQAAEGDKELGNILHLFAHWSNDVQSVAAHMGIGIERVDNDEHGSILRVRRDIPEAPSPDHWWDEGKWNEPTSVAGPAFVSGDERA